MQIHKYSPTRKLMFCAPFLISALLFFTFGCKKREFADKSLSTKVKNARNETDCRLLDSNAERPLLRLARRGACYSQLFNMRGAKNKGFELERHLPEAFGPQKIPAWRITGELAKKAALRLQISSLVDNKLTELPFGAKATLYAHPFDKKANTLLRNRFGLPEEFESWVLSSGRTLLVLPTVMPEDARPFYLKVSGLFISGLGEFKHLSLEEVETSLARSKYLAGVLPELLRDSHAAVLSGGDFAEYRTQNAKSPDSYNLLFREFPYFEKRWPDVNLDDLEYLPGHVLASEEFWESSLARDILGSTEAERQLWTAEVLAPAFADLMFDAVVNASAHLEMHFQNVDFLVGARGVLKGKILAVTYKDLADVVEDPLLMVARGTHLRPIVEGFGFAESSAWLQPLAQKYSGKFGWMSKEERTLPVFLDRVANRLRQRFREFSAQEGFTVQELVVHPQNSEFYDTTVRTADDLAKVVVSMRSLLVNIYLTKNLQPALPGSSEKLLQARQSSEGRRMVSNCPYEAEYDAGRYQATELKGFAVRSRKLSNGLTIPFAVRFHKESLAVRCVLTQLPDSLFAN